MSIIRKNKNFSKRLKNKQVSYELHRILSEFLSEYLDNICGKKLFMYVSIHVYNSGTNFQ